MKNSRAAINSAQILIFVGGAIIALVGFLALLGVPLSFSFMSGHVMVYPIYGMSGYIGAIELICGALIILSAFLMGRRNSNEIQYWSASALVFAIIGLIGGGGLLIGSTITLIGSIFGMSYRPDVMQNVNVLRTSSARNAAIDNRNHKQIRMTMASLKGEERKLYEITSGSGGAIFQADLVEKSGFSKVKVSRILDRLEGRGLIERRRRGMTNMVIMKNDQRPAAQPS